MGILQYSLCLGVSGSFSPWRTSSRLSGLVPVLWGRELQQAASHERRVMGAQRQEQGQHALPARLHLDAFQVLLNAPHDPRHLQGMTALRFPPLPAASGTQDIAWHWEGGGQAGMQGTASLCSSHGALTSASQKRGSLTTTSRTSFAPWFSQALEPLSPLMASWTRSPRSGGRRWFANSFGWEETKELR